MLIQTHRHTKDDIEEWQYYVELDSVSSWNINKERQSIAEIRQFLSANQKSCIMTSWGKDSIVLLDLFLKTGLSRPVVHMQVEHRSNPDCDLVRDVFLKKNDIDYHEHVYGYDEVEKSEKHWNDLHNTYGVRCSGIRNDESKIRMLQWRLNKFKTKNSCRPLSLWNANEIFAYIHHNQLPLSPVYGYLGGGRYKRQNLRTHALHSFADMAGSGLGRIEWEKEYYIDIINKAQKFHTT